MDPTASQERALTKEIEAFNAVKEQLEKTSMGKWVVFHDAKHQGTYDDFNAAAKDAAEKFGRGPYLIRQVGEYKIVLPASVVYSTHHNAS